MTELETILDDVMERIYEEAEPGLDWHDLTENPEKYPDNWYEHHHLDSDRQEEIVADAVDEHDLMRNEATALRWAAIIDFGPQGTNGDT